MTTDESASKSDLDETIDEEVFHILEDFNQWMSNHFSFLQTQLSNETNQSSNKNSNDRILSPSINLSGSGKYQSTKMKSMK
jgi:hypothetical protein